MRSPSKVTGYTLLSLLVGILLFSTVSLLIHHAWLLVQKSARNVIELSEQMQSLRTVQQVISHAFLSAGHFGCRQLNNTYPVYSTLPELPQLQAHQGIWVNNDQLTVISLDEPLGIRYINDNRIALSKSVQTDKSTLLFVHDCYQAQQIAPMGPAGDYSTIQLSQAISFDHTAKLSKANWLTFYYSNGTFYQKYYDSPAQPLCSHLTKVQFTMENKAIQVQVSTKDLQWSAVWPLAF